MTFCINGTQHKNTRNQHVMLSVIMLRVFMLSVIMLNVVAPLVELYSMRFRHSACTINIVTIVNYAPKSVIYDRSIVPIL